MKKSLKVFQLLSSAEETFYNFQFHSLLGAEKINSWTKPWTTSSLFLTLFDYFGSFGFLAIDRLQECRLENVICIWKSIELQGICFKENNHT